MSEFIYTKKRTRQYNGPVSSEDYNARIEENYQDLVYLYNKYGIIDQKLSESFERVLKDHIFISNYIRDIDDRISALEASENQLSIHSFSQVDLAAIPSGDLAIQADELLSLDPVYNTITLPKVTGASHSKVKFFTELGGQIIPDFFETRISNSLPGVDLPGAIIDGTYIYNAIMDRSDKFWKRNIIAPTPDPVNGAQTYVYFKVPAQYTGSTKVNNLRLNPFPAFGVDILSIQYTTKLNPLMDESDGWTALNKDRLYDLQTDAVGKVPPGGWSTVNLDTIQNAGPLSFYFPDLDITAFRVLMKQRNYLIENGKYIYSYGLSDLDIRYDKFLPTGKSIFKFTAPAGTTISGVNNVTPKIYNVSLSLMSEAFDYRIIYTDGSVYTTENPGSSQSIWIEITLNQLPDGTAPVLSDLVIDYY